MPKKRTDGRYEIKVRISREGEPRRYKAVYGSTLREAQEKKRALEAEIAAGVDATQNPTVTAVVQEWLAVKSITTRPQTVTAYTCAMKHITEAIGDRLAKAVDVTTARKVISDIASAVSPYQANRCRKLTAAAWKDAIIRGVISTNPWEKVPIIPLNSAEKRSLSDKELDKIDKADLLPKDRALISVLRYTGCRISEAMALTVQDLDFDTLTISINKSLYNGVPGLTKTKAGVRRVPMPQVLADDLKHYLTTTHIGSEILFPTRVGTYVNNSTRNKRWKIISHRIFGDAVPADFTPHIFRHTYASTLVKNHIPPTTAQLLLGHDSLQTTLKVYTHFGYSDIDTDAVRNIFSSNRSSNIQKST